MSETTKQISLNGVDVTRLEETKDAVTKDSELAQFGYIVRNRWIAGAHNRSVIREFYAGGELDETRQDPFVVHNDAAKVALGHDAGANPLEFALHALVGCLTTTLVYHAAARGIRLEEVETTIEADQDARGFLGVSNNVRNGFEGVRINFRIKGDAPEDKLNELLLLAQKRSPVYDIFSNPVDVQVTGELEQVSTKAA